LRSRGRVAYRFANEPAVPSLHQWRVALSHVVKASVLVTCYRRREFLRDAVGSVLSTGPIGPELEIVVIKDWGDPATDSWLRESGVKLVVEDIPLVGEMMARGLQECTGESVSFLDDDDLFAPEKMSAVRAAFEADPELLLLRNGWREVKVDGSPHPDRHLAQPEQAFSFRTDAVTPTIFRWITERRAYGTLSTQSVRRRTLESRETTLRSVECTTDVSMAILMMNTPGRHSFDPRPLTVRRVGSGRRYAHPIRSGAFVRTFSALWAGSTSPAAREYSEMNLRWGRLEILLGRPRLALVEEWTDRFRRQRRRIDAVFLKDSFRTFCKFLLPRTTEKVTRPEGRE
jgi:glycosyltransferase involved in cell wall biosynthesis